MSGLSLKGRLQEFFAAIDREHPLLLIDGCLSHYNRQFRREKSRTR
jgi:hypothetical protein